MKFDAVRHFGSYRPHNDIFKKIGYYSDTTLYIGINNSRNLDEALTDLLAPFEEKTVQIFTRKKEDRNKNDAKEAQKLLSSHGYFVKYAYGKEKDETNLFIKNLPADKSQDEIKEIFNDVLNKLEQPSEKLISIKFLNRQSNDVPLACMIRFRNAEISKLVLDYITNNNEYQLECRYADKAIYNPSNYNYNNSHVGHNFQNSRKSNNLMPMHNFSRILTPQGYVQFNPLNHFQNLALLQANNPRFYSPMPYIHQTANNSAYNLYQPFHMNNSFVTPGTLLNSMSSYMPQKQVFDNMANNEVKSVTDKSLSQESPGNDKSTLKNNNSKISYNNSPSNKFDAKNDSNLNKQRNSNQMNSNHVMRADYNPAAAATVVTNGQYQAVLNPGYQLNGYPLIFPQYPVMMNNTNQIRIQPNMASGSNVAPLSGNLTSQNNLMYQMTQGTNLLNQSIHHQASQHSAASTPSNGQQSKMLYYSFDTTNGGNPSPGISGNPQLAQVSEAQNYFINPSHIPPHYSIVYSQQQSQPAPIGGLNHQNHQFNPYPTSTDPAGVAASQPMVANPNNNTSNPSTANNNPNIFYLMPNYNSGGHHHPGVVANGTAAAAAKKLYPDPLNALQSQFSAINLANGIGGGTFIHPSQLTPSNDSVKSTSQSQSTNNNNSMSIPNNGTIVTSSNVTSSSSSGLPQQSPKKLYEIIPPGVNSSDS